MNKLLNEIIIKERNNIPKLYEPTISYHDNYEFELLLKNEYLLLLKFNKGTYYSLIKSIFFY